MLPCSRPSKMSERSVPGSVPLGMTCSIETGVPLSEPCAWHVLMGPPLLRGCRLGDRRPSLSLRAAGAGIAQRDRQQRGDAEHQCGCGERHDGHAVRKRLACVMDEL